MKKYIKSFDNLYEDINIGIDNDKDTINFLNKLLSNHFILFLKLWNFHWNVFGSGFMANHKFLNELYDKFFEDIDSISEIIRALGGRQIVTLKGYLDKTDLKEYDDDKYIPKVEKMYEIILEDYESIIKDIRKFLGDKVDNGTSNFLEDMIMKKEKDAWMVRSNIEKNKEKSDSDSESSDNSDN